MSILKNDIRILNGDQRELLTARVFGCFFVAASAFLFLSVPPASADGTPNCLKPASPIERAVCTSGELQALHLMASQGYATYAARRANFDAPMSGMPASHDEWLAEHAPCGEDRNCLRQSYIARLSQLTAALVTFDARANKPVVIAVEPESGGQCNPGTEATGDGSCIQWLNPESRLRGVIVGDRMAFRYYSAFANGNACEVDGLAEKFRDGWRFKGEGCMADIKITNRSLSIESVSNCPHYCGALQYASMTFPLMTGK